MGRDIGQQKSPGVGRWVILGCGIRLEQSELLNAVKVALVASPESLLVAICCGYNSRQLCKVGK